MVVVAGVPVEVLVEVLVEEPLAYTVFHPSSTTHHVVCGMYAGANATLTYTA